MSFQVVCSGCGAPSSPSVGMCPFCKTVMSTATGKQRRSINQFLKLYNEGQLEQALSMGAEICKLKPEMKTDLVFVLHFAKILLETEGPSSMIRSLLAEAHLAHPENKDVLDYLEIVEAKKHLKKGLNDLGETALKKLLKRSPKNVHAHFILGTHFFWIDKEFTMAIPHLETCVRLHPNFLRAWGCLGAIYRKMGNFQLAQKAFLKCASIESNQHMKEFFEKQSKAS